MLISWAILSRVAAVGVGFLLNSSSSVTSWSWVARWRLLFFCCWVKVLFRGGRRAELGAVLALELGDGVEVTEDGDIGFTVAMVAAEETDGSGVLVEDMFLCQEGVEECRCFEFSKIVNRVETMTSRRREIGIRETLSTASSARDQTRQTSESASADGRASRPSHKMSAYERVAEASEGNQKADLGSVEEKEREPQPYR